MSRLRPASKVPIIVILCKLVLKFKFSTGLITFNLFDALALTLLCELGYFADTGVFKIGLHQGIFYIIHCLLRCLLELGGAGSSESNFSTPLRFAARDC